jgi:uncharacterized protein (DUF885 family)
VPEPRHTAERDLPPRPPERDAALWDLAHRYWTLTLSAEPLTATLLGIHDHDDRVDDLSEEVEQRHRDDLDRIRRQLHELAAETLTAADRVTRSLLDHQLEVAIRSADLRLTELASDHMNGPHAALLMIAPQLTYPEPEHAEAALVRYSQIPRLLGQAIDRFRAGLAAGRTPAGAVIGRSINSLSAYLDGPLDSDPFLGAALPAEWEQGDQRRADEWRAELHDLLRDRIRPAFGIYRDVLRDELAPRARDDEHAGWKWLPDGDELYAALIHAHTTVETTPLALHELGRDLTERLLPDEYRALAPHSLGTSDLHEIFRRLREDPELRHRDAEEILATARETVARATLAMPEWFGRIPGSRCEVTPIPDFLAADAPYAYYFPPAADGTRAGTYFINTADPEGASRTEAQSIAFHEAIPGHHLQIAISQELGDMPEFQRHDGATSYIEGWGLYAERLADEMGLYSGDLDRLGMLTADSWRSARLVVDTGLHALGWERSRAVEYFREHTPVPDDQIHSEVDRYLAIPAQALSYKVGHLEIRRLRDDASERLGSRFDPSDFHDVVLGSGAVTLPVLGELVDEWVRASA